MLGPNQAEVQLSLHAASNDDGHTSFELNLTHDYETLCFVSTDKVRVRKQLNPAGRRQKLCVEVVAGRKDQRTNRREALSSFELNHRHDYERLCFVSTDKV